MILTGKPFSSISKTAILLWAGSMASAYGQGDTARSPFERVTSAPAISEPQASVGPSRLDHMEFTGMLAVGDEITISLFDTKTNQSVWVPLHGSEEGLQVTNLDEATGRITVTLQGMSKEIAINENEIVAVKRAPQSSGQRANTAIEKKPVKPKDPEILKKEAQAREFMTNLLANGLEQRERYRREREARLAGNRSN